MSEPQAMCACRHIEYYNDDTHGTVTKEWWACRDCGTIYIKQRIAEADKAQLQAELKAAHESARLANKGLAESEDEADKLQAQVEELTFTDRLLQRTIDRQSAELAGWSERYKTLEAQLKQAVEDSRMLDCLQDFVEGGIVTAAFEIDGGVHLTVCEMGSEEVAYREQNSLRDAIRKLMEDREKDLRAAMNQAKQEGPTTAHGE